MSSSNSNNGGSPIPLHQQLPQQVLPEQPLNLNQYMQLQQYQQYLQQQQQQQQQQPSNELMASPMAQSNNNSNPGFGQALGGAYTGSYQQQNFMQFFQYQQQQQQLLLLQQQQQLLLQQHIYQALQNHQQVSSTNNQLRGQPLNQQSLPIAQLPVQHYLPHNTVQFTPPVVANSSPQGNPSGSQTGTKNSANRKRQRRSDHALPGDEGDSELKELAYKALEIPFEEFAAQVRLIENGASRLPSPGDGGKSMKEEDSTKERKRQVFGMVCLIRSCKLSPKAVVPRNRIYAGYASICASNGVVPLSAASFGKLVRLLFPSITTRRLGMRGQSKYHYCGIQIIGDTSSPFNSPSAETPSGSPFTTPRTGNSLEGTSGNSPMSIVSRTSSITNMNQTFIGTSHSSTPVTLDTDFKNYITPYLKFSSNLLDELQNSQLDLTSTDVTTLNLPSIQQYVPPGVDPDVASTLESLYKAHCNSVFESLRYMQLKKLFNYASSFAFSLTAPVYKLYTSESIQSWVVSCDIIMYQSVMRMFSKLALQKIPAYVSQQLRFIVKNYTEKCQISLKKLPADFVRLKLRPAENFARLTSRLSKVSNSSTSASKILLNTNERQKMLADWEKCDFNDIIDKDIPCSNQLYTDKILAICTRDVPELLKYDPFLELDDDQLNAEEKYLKLHSLLMNKWTVFLNQLPQHFTTIPPRMFLLCLSSVLTTTLREMTLLEGQSFGEWWIIRCWVDDWLGWCAELTGFLDLNGPSVQREQREQTTEDSSTTVTVKVETDELRSDELSTEVGETNNHTNGDPGDIANVDDLANDYTNEDALNTQNPEVDEIDLLNI